MKKWKVILLVVLLAAVLLGASVLYDTVKDQAAPEALMTVETTMEATPQTEETTFPPQTSEAPETTESTEVTETTEETEAQDMSAPDFTVYDLEGNALSLSDLQGKPVIINFWATWCGYCVAEMPEFQAAFETYGDRIHFMMVNVTDGYQETQEDASAYIQDAGFTFPVYYDLDLSATYAYAVNAMPVTYFIDANGDFVAWGQGALNAETIRQGIDMLLETEEEVQ